MASAAQAELVFVVDVSALTNKGFVGSTTYEGNAIELEFDDGHDGVFLTSEMAGRLHVKKGSKVSVATENERNLVAEALVGGVGKTVRISNEKVYYEIGKAGGAIVRVRRA